MSGIGGLGKNQPAFNEIFETFKPGKKDDSKLEEVGKKEVDKGEHLRGDKDGRIYLHTSWEGIITKKVELERAQKWEWGGVQVYNAIARDYGKDVADLIFPDGYQKELFSGDLPGIKARIDDHISPEGQRRRQTEQFKDDLWDLKRPGGKVSDDTISRMMKHIENRSENRGWGSLLLALGKGEVPQHLAQLMPPEVRLNITQRMGPQTIAREMMKDVLTAIDRLKRGQETHDDIDKLNGFIKWAGKTNDPDVPEDLLKAIKDFRVNLAKDGSGIERRMDVLELPPEVRAPLREAFRLRALYESPPTQPPPLQSSYRDEQEMLTAVYDNQYFPEHMREWEKGGFDKIPGKIEEQLQKIRDVPNNGVPSWLLDELST